MVYILSLHSIKIASNCLMLILSPKWNNPLQIQVTGIFILKIQSTKENLTIFHWNAKLVSSRHIYFLANIDGLMYSSSSFGVSSYKIWQRCGRALLTFRIPIQLDLNWIATFCSMNWASVEFCVIIHVHFLCLEWLYLFCLHGRREN